MKKDSLSLSRSLRPQNNNIMTDTTTPNSKGAKVAGWILTILPSLLLLMSASFKLIKLNGFEEGIKEMGWDPATMFYIGIVELACVVIYLIPRTAVLGAILIAAYMGGAVATSVRAGDPFLTQVLLGMFVWAGLWFRYPSVRALIPIRT